MLVEQDRAAWTVGQELQPYATCKRKMLTDPVSYQVGKCFAHQVYVYPKGELQVWPGFLTQQGKIVASP